MNGIELQDREFFAAIREGREPNSSVAQVLPCYRTLDALERQLTADRRPRGFPALARPRRCAAFERLRQGDARTPSARGVADEKGAKAKSAARAPRRPRRRRRRRRWRSQRLQLRFEAIEPSSSQQRQPLFAPDAQKLGIGAFAVEQSGVGRQPHLYLGIRTHMSKSSTTLGS